MSNTVVEAMSQLSHLSPEERVELAQALLQSLGSSELDPVWEKELARRVDEIRTGRVQGKPAQQLFAELKAQRS